MKKQFVLTSVLCVLLLILAACGGKAAKLSDKSLVGKSTLTVTDGAISEMTVLAKESNGTGYQYTKTSDKEALTEATTGLISKVTFAQLQKGAGTLATYIQKEKLVTAASYSIQFNPELQWYDTLTGAAGEPPYYVYSLSKNTLVPGDGAYAGAKTYGIFTFHNTAQALCTVAVDD